MKAILRSFLPVWCAVLMLGSANAQTYEIQIDSVVGIPDTVVNGQTVNFFMQVSLNSPLAYQGDIFIELEYGGQFYEVDSAFVNQNFLNPNNPNTIQATHRFSTDEDLSIGDNVVVVWPRIGDGTTPPQVVVNPYDITISIVEPNSISGSRQNGVEPLKLYPNPADNFIQIPTDISDPLIHIRLINLAGQVVIDAPFTDNTIDISETADGLYFLEAYSEEGVRHSTKVIVSHH